MEVTLFYAISTMVISFIVGYYTSEMKLINQEADEFEELEEVEPVEELKQAPKGDFKIYNLCEVQVRDKEWR